jgi:hypothetical protein
MADSVTETLGYFGLPSPRLGQGLHRSWAKPIPGHVATVTEIQFHSLSVWRA